MLTHYTPESLCPTCGANLNAATSPQGPQKPKPDDLSVCAYCSSTLVYQPDLSLRLITDEEEASLDSEILYHLEKIRSAIKIAHIKKEKTHEA